MQLSLSDKPLHTGGRVLRLSKSYTMQEPRSHTTLTDDVFPFVEFYFARKRKALRYGNIELKKKYGKASQYDCQFYWKQAETFYRAAKLLPIESSPLAA